jgi:DNA gyrase subunit A
MPKKTEEKPKASNPNVMGLHAEVLEQPITDMLEVNYMPYAMSVIVSRAIPEIDGLKPSHRKLLYTMYKMGLLNGGRTKSANIVGQTMRLNPHGDAAIYDTMVRLSRGYGALLHPLVDSKGNFGKAYSRDMAWAAPRYTEARLDPITQEFFRDIDQESVDFVDNYDSTMKEPALLPTTFPNILVSANKGIAVGMASDICGFNLAEVCDTTIALINDTKHDIMATLPAPDLPSGGEILYNAAAMAEIYNTGRGTFKVRARWRHLKKENIIEVYEIPYSTTTEAIIEKVTELVKTGKVREISDIRDETDLNGLKLAIDLKRGADAEKVMSRLFKLTPLLDSQSCNFNVLIDGQPKVLGVRDILNEWINWRTECVRRRLQYSIQKRSEKLHLLKGLASILLDIDKAVKIIRETKEDAKVIPNLMEGFDLDQAQAEYVADIRLRNINQEYIIKRTKEIAALEKEIASLESTVKSPKKIQKVITKELEEVKKKYGAPRKTAILYDVKEEPDGGEEEAMPDYLVNVFLSREGYLKKITPLSLRMASEQKYKDGDGLSQQWEASNRDEILIFTAKQQCYKARLYEFDDTKASALGDYLPSKLGMAPDEKVVWACLPGDYSGSLLLFFENGKAARVELAAYQTQSRRRKLTGAYSDKSPLAAVMLIKEDRDLAVISTEGRCIIFNTEALAVKATRSAQGVSVMSPKKNHRVEKVIPLEETSISKVSRYRAKTLPAVGMLLTPQDKGE